MLRNLNRSVTGGRVLGTPYVGMLAEVIILQTASGDDGPGILYNEAIIPAHAGKYLRAEVTSMPSVGVFVIEENGTVTASSLPVGLHQIGYNFYVNNDLQTGSAVFSMEVGLVVTSTLEVTSNSIINIGAGIAQPVSTLNLVAGSSAYIAASIAGASPISMFSVTGTTSFQIESSVVVGASPISVISVIGTTNFQIASSAVVVVGDPRFTVRTAKKYFTSTYVNSRTDSIDPTEKRVVTFDFTDDLEVGETLTGAITVSVTCVLGTDATPENVLNGSATLDVTNKKVFQPIKGWLIDHDYSINAVVGTTNAQKVLAMVAHVPIRTEL